MKALTHQTRTLLTSAQPLPREDALKLFPIGTTVAKKSDSEIIRGQVYDYRAQYWTVQYEETIGRSCHDKRCTEWPEHIRTTLTDSTPNPSASVTFLVCNRPQQQARPLHSFFFFFFFFSPPTANTNLFSGPCFFSSNRVCVRTLP